jgi:hypothetical protein
VEDVYGDGHPGRADDVLRRSIRNGASPYRIATFDFDV